VRATSCKFYLQVEADTYRSVYGDSWIRELRAKKITRRKPAKPLPGVVVVAVTLNLPDMLFVPCLEVPATEIK
jgi:hypothetical protein